MVKARKDYKCCECYNVIHKGEVYENAFGVWESWQVVSPGVKRKIADKNTYRTCRKCVSIRDHFFPDGWLYGQMAEAMFEIRYYTETDDDEDYDGPEPLRGARLHSQYLGNAGGHEGSSANRVNRGSGATAGRVRRGRE
jgi:hypothetical protein